MNADDMELPLQRSISFQQDPYFPTLEVDDMGVQSRLFTSPPIHFRSLGHRESQYPTPYFAPAVFPG